MVVAHLAGVETEPSNAAQKRERGRKVCQSLDKYRYTVMRSRQQREIEVTGKYLLVPVRAGGEPDAVSTGIGGKNPGDRGSFFEGSIMNLLTVTVEGTRVHSVDLLLPERPEDVAWWATLDMTGYCGKMALLTTDSGASRALDMFECKDHPRSLYPEYSEKLRPQLRFSQRRGWNNDANGMTWFDGEWHLFWQCNPVGNAMCNMYWGHAVSTDLVHWEELSPALRPWGDDTVDRHPAMADGRCHSGGGNVDFNNSGGWAKSDTPAMLLTFTDTGYDAAHGGRLRRPESFSERIAISTDRGRNWRMYNETPIIKHRGRDPKVFWYAPGKHWVIAVYDVDENETNGGIAFYTSRDLKHWEYRSKICGYHECPEIFQGEVVEQPGEHLWFMCGGDARYHLGHFDGTTFTPVTDEKQRFAFGKVYGGQCFTNAPDNRHVYIGWGRFAFASGKTPFSQGFTLPIELTLHKTEHGPVIHAAPARELDALRKKEVQSVRRQAVNSRRGLVFAMAGLTEGEIELTITPAAKAEMFTLTFGETPITYNFATGQFCEHGFAPLIAGKLHLRVFIDRPCCEIFYNRQCYEMKPRQGEPINEVKIWVDGTIDELTLHQVKSIR